MKKFKFIILIMLIANIWVMFSPFVVFAMDEVDSNVEDILKDGSKDVDFTYQFDLLETFEVIYGEKALEDTIENYIVSKIGTDYSVVVDKKNYTIKQEENEIYTGNFAYNLVDKLEITLNNENRIEAIKSYIEQNTNFKENIVINELNSSNYEIIINDKKSTFLVNFIETKEEDTSPIDNIDVKYQAHVQNIGWQSYVSNEQIAGTEGKGLRLEAIKIKIENSNVSGGIEYQTHVQSIGWQQSVGEDILSGTTKRALRVESIRIKLTGELAEKYDIYYSTHIQNKGWLGWAKNGESAGSAGYALRLEALKIKIVPKDSLVEDSLTSFYEATPEIYSSEHVQNKGWLSRGKNKDVIGTTGKSLRLEALKLSLSSYDSIGDIEYSVNVQNKGWQDYVKNGEVAGSTGEGLRLEAIKIRLTEDLAKKFDIYYRVHISSSGWLGWTLNDQPAGTSGLFSRIEALQIKIVPKGSVAPGNMKDAYIENGATVKYSTHVANIGWQDYFENGELAGTTGQAKAVEAIKIDVSGPFAGNVEYQAYVQNKGWQNSVSNNDIAGTTGKTRYIEAIKINLTGELKEKYDIYYRTHVANIGWLDWAKNGEAAGNNGNNRWIEAIEIQLVNKNFTAPGTTTKPYITGNWITKNGHKYYYDCFGNLTIDFRVIDGVKYFFNARGELVGSNVKQMLDVSKYQQTINWGQVYKYNDIDGVMIRALYRGYETGLLVEDEYFYTNVNGAKNQGYNVGAYVFSQAINEKEAKEEANKVIDMVRKAGGLSIINMPIVFDTEFSSCNENGKRCGRADNLTKQQRTNIAKTFLETVKSAGFTPMLYASTNFLYDQLDMNELSQYKLWVAQYNYYCTYKGNYDMWQYSSSEHVQGITGNVDSSVWFA